MRLSGTGWFGSNDKPICPKCGAAMRLVRRSPHSTFGSDYETQIFACSKCHPRPSAARIRMASRTCIAAAYSGALPVMVVSICFSNARESSWAITARTMTPCGALQAA